jgi:hypothetical protein
LSLITCQLNQVIAIALLAKAGNHDQGIFETWINAHDPTGQGLRMVELLSTQDTMLMQLFTQSTSPARTLSSPNYLKRHAGELIQQITSSKPWSMMEFNEAKLQLSSLFPSVQHLWNHH